MPCHFLLTVIEPAMSGIRGIVLLPIRIFAFLLLIWGAIIIRWASRFWIVCRRLAMSRGRRRAIFTKTAVIVIPLILPFPWRYFRVAFWTIVIIICGRLSWWTWGRLDIMWARSIWGQVRFRFSIGGRSCVVRAIAFVVIFRSIPIYRWSFRLVI